MKLPKIAAFLVLTGGLMAPAAFAQVTPLTYTDGDLFLGFRAKTATAQSGDNTLDNTGTTKDYLINIGPATAFLNATSSFTVTTGDVQADLGAAFGPGWRTRSNVYWGVAGTKSSDITLYASKAQGVAGVVNQTGYDRGSATAQGTPRNKINSLKGAYTFLVGVPNNSTANNPKGLIQNTSDTNSWASFQPDGISAGTPSGSFSYFGQTLEGNFRNGTKGSVIELYQALTGTGDATLIGLFTIDDSGAVTFAPASRTPNAAVANGNSTLQFQAAKFAVTETASTIPVTIIRGGDLSQAVSVKVSTLTGGANGTALAGKDFNALTASTVSFAAGETSKQISVVLPSTVNKSGVQADRTFTLTLSGQTVGSTIGANAQGVIHDSASSKLAFVATTYGVDYTSATRTITIPVTRTAAGGGLGIDTVAVSVDNTGVTGTILTPSQYTLSASSLFFSEGEVTKNLTVTIPASSPFPASFRLKLTGSSLGSNVATVVSHTKNDKTAPTIALTSPATTPTTAGLVDITGSVKDAFVTVRPYSAFSVSLNGSVLSTTAPTRTTANAADAFSLTGVQLENGSNLIEVAATDYSGNTAVLKKTIVFNNGVLSTQTAGIYNGVLVASGAVSNDTTGFVTITVSGNATFSGKVTLSGITVPVKGFLNNAGQAKFAPTNLTGFDLVDKVEFDSYLGALSFSVVGNADATLRTASGTLNTAVTGGTPIATFTAPNTPYSASAPVTSTVLLNQTTKGVYSVALPSKAQSPVLATNLFPQGDGVGALSLSPAGAVTLKGNLADGTAYSLAGRLTAQGTVALHANLYKKAGALAGVITFANAADSDVAGTDLLWIRPAQPRARYYPAGWATGIKVDAAGTAQSNVAATAANFGQGADDITGSSPVGNASIVFADGGLTSTVTKGVNINSTTGKVSLFPLTPTPTDYKVTFSATSGAIGGFFTHSDSTKPVIKAVLLNKGANKGGFGYFLSTPPVTYGGSGFSGGVSLQP